MPTPPSNDRELLLWVDADPSGLTWTGLDCDDDLAILLALKLLPFQQFVGMSICGGNAPLKHTSANVNILKTHVQQKFPNVHLGRGWMSMMPLKFSVLKFFNYISPDMADSDDAALAMIHAAESLPPQSLSILMLGPCTNLARAFELAPWLPRHLKQVVVMGGEMTQSTLDLNFLMDRNAARIVLEADVPTLMLPIQTCGQVIITGEWVKEFEATCCPQSEACAVLPKMKLQTKWMPFLVNRAVSKKFERSKEWKPSPMLDSGFIPWDVVALLAVLEPRQLFEDWQYHNVHVCNSTAYQLQCNDSAMTILRDSYQAPSNHSNWARVPHVVKNETDLLHLVFETFCAERGDDSSRQIQRPQLLMGYLSHIIGMVALVFLTAACLVSFLVCRCSTRRRGKLKNE